MTEALHVGGLRFEVRRSPRRKTVGITVERDRSLSVHVPTAVDLDRVRPIIEARLVWVHRRLLVAPPASRAPDDGVFRRKDIVDGEGFPFLGRHFRLRIARKRADEGPTPAVRIKGDDLILRADQVEAGERRIAEWYTREAYPHLNRVVRRWAPRLGVTPARFLNVQDLGYRWGSCGVGGTLNFHWRVMQLPPALIDYVVVHELAHLRVPNHDPAFWTVVRGVMPDYEAHRMRLKDEGGTL